MNNSVRITVLVENSVHRQSLVAEHGLSFYVEFGGETFLFDTGQSDAILTNVRILRLSLDNLKAIMLSHGHYDHTGGLPAVLKAAARSQVYLHPAAFEPKFSRGPMGKTRFIGMDPATVQALRVRPGVVATPTWTRIREGLFVTGEIPRRTSYEDTGGAFFQDAEATRPDPLLDDQSLVIDLGKSLVVLLGCAHAGVVNTLDHVRRLVPEKAIRAVIGGCHLGSASEERLERTILHLGEARLQCLAPLHCTGWPATARLWQSFPKSFRPGDVGAVFEFPAD